MAGRTRARPAESSDRLAAPAAFVITGVSIGLLAADQGGYFPGAWRLATPFYAAVVVAILAGARELRVPRAALVTVAGLAGLCAWTAASWLWSADRHGDGARRTSRPRVRRGRRGARCCSQTAGAGWRSREGSSPRRPRSTCFSMASRLYPRIFGMYNTGGGYGRLYQPIGYWNGLGAFSVIAIILALGFAARGGMLTRMLAAAALIPLAPTLYLTFSRGALVGLAAGLVALVALDRNRVQLIVAAVAGSIGAAGALLAVHGHRGAHEVQPRARRAGRPGRADRGPDDLARPARDGRGGAARGARGPVHGVALARTLAGAGMVLAACAAVAVGVNRFGNPVSARARRGRTRSRSRRRPSRRATSTCAS